MSDDEATETIDEVGGGPVVTVRGEASVEVESDLVDLHLSVQARGTDRTEVVGQLEERAAELGRLVDRFERAIERRSTDGFSVHPEFSGSRGQKLMGYSGSLSMQLTPNDFAVLSDLVVGVNAIELCTVGSPYWHLRREHPAYREARLAAISDGMRRARDYAAAFDAGIDALLAISDDGMDTEAVMPRFKGGHAYAARAMSGGAPEDSSFDFEPTRQRVEGAVALRLAMTKPTLPA